MRHGEEQCSLGGRTLRALRALRAFMAVVVVDLWCRG